MSNSTNLEAMLSYNSGQSSLSLEESESIYVQECPQLTKKSCTIVGVAMADRK